MLGYVRIHKPELKVKEYEVYRGLYCTLCKRLGKNYGIVSRLMLSYDLTFLALVILAVTNTAPDFKRGRCPFNPAKSCNYCQNADGAFDYAAAVTVIMFYYKVRDNIADGGFFKRLLMYLILPYAALKRRKAKKEYEKLDAAVSLAMKQQAQTEQSATDSFDKAAHCSADALGKIFCRCEEDAPTLYRFGYMVGRWVYLIDAADDIEKDIKHSSFNVFVNKYGLTDVNQLTLQMLCEIEATLNMSCAAAVQAYNELEITTLFPIIENVLFDGMSCSADNVVERFHERSSTT